MHPATASKPLPYNLTERWRVSSAKLQKLVCGNIARCTAPCSKCTPVFLLQSSRYRAVPHRAGQAFSHLIIYSRLIINCRLKQYSLMLYVMYFGLKLWGSLFFPLKRNSILRENNIRKSLPQRAVEKTQLFSTFQTGMVRSCLLSLGLIELWLMAVITLLIFNPDVTKEGWVNIFSAMWQTSVWRPFE